MDDCPVNGTVLVSLVLVSGESKYGTGEKKKRNALPPLRPCGTQSQDFFCRAHFSPLFGGCEIVFLMLL